MSSEDTQLVDFLVTALAILFVAFLLLRSGAAGLS